MLFHVSSTIVRVSYRVSSRHFYSWLLLAVNRKRIVRPSHEAENARAVHYYPAGATLISPEKLHAHSNRFHHAVL